MSGEEMEQDTSSLFRKSEKKAEQPEEVVNIDQMTSHKRKKGRFRKYWLSIILAIVLVLSNFAWILASWQNNPVPTDQESDYSKLQKRLSNLQSAYDSLIRQLIDHQMTNESLENEIQVLNAIKLESTVEDYYQSVREYCNMDTSGWLYNFNSDQNRVDFCAELADHDIGKKYWPLLEKEYINYYGTYSYNDAAVVMHNFINLTGIQLSKNSTLNILQILNIVNHYVKYRPDINDRYNSPWETLAFSSGDCDDFSTLVSALFKIAGIDSAIGFFKNSTGAYHAMVLVHLDNLGGYDCFSSADLTNKGLASGRWITIEPQWPIYWQNKTSINEWNLVVASVV